ncbi:transcriptional regulator [Conexibacter sp. SYSU D00693]|uniref:ArsR/SmtB family transcription factor n=1 Tax=Conexibacter sp. SYSU D00693 TaxID=2812560 RepID=UPI00196B0808|nr:winged helix-turn-helix domain-containing protein [Conexibacter sp. SYSU D00693]
MPTTRDAADPRIHKALSHPIRVEILRALDDGLASAVEVSRATGHPLGQVSYHFNQLAQLGLIELRKTTPRRGALERHYGLIETAPTAAADWRKLTKTARRNEANTVLGEVADQIAGALKDGGFDSSDSHARLEDLKLDARGRRDAAKEVTALVKRLRAIEKESAKRAKDKPDDLAQWAVAVLQYGSRGA